MIFWDFHGHIFTYSWDMDKRVTKANNDFKYLRNQNVFDKWFFQVTQYFSCDFRPKMNKIPYQKNR